MPTLKLARLPDRVPVKLALHVLPDLYQALTEYVVMYAEAYGEQVRVEDLVPAMLASFLESDRGFAAARAERA
ncbi:DUF2274 domain-containing protein, partial [Sphingomonas sp.]|uniref:DUF2274 domain-containing protein n=1 Tax=Sphingomonas sp. TaxID=28214 RepID=UPI0025F34E1E